MLLHDFLRRKAAILAKSKAEVDNLLTEISDPRARETVDDWEPGDPITDEYPQTDAQPKKEGAHTPDSKAPKSGGDSLSSDTHLEDTILAKEEGGGEPAKDSEVKEPAAASEPASPDVPDPVPPVVDGTSKSEDNTNHTA